uniref:superoxide dismutase n=1 Tax=Lygus hesperus TaxID=30085 RepID=A0A0A9WSG5_LYGHE
MWHRSFSNCFMFNTNKVAMCAYTTFAKLKFPAELPKLCYPVDEGIKPVLSERQLELHYTKHHKAYVDKLNMLAKDMGYNTVEEIMHATHKKKDQMTIFNQAAQHFNHTLYWYVLKPNGAPLGGALEQEITKAFGSV